VRNACSEEDLRTTLETSSTPAGLSGPERC
jgi:hypothetical protein